MDGRIVPKGEGMRRAVRWLDEQRREQPQARMYRLVERASVRFDLSPLEEQFLLERFGDEGTRRGGRRS